MSELLHEVLIVGRVRVPSQYLDDVSVEVFTTPTVSDSEPELADLSDAEIDEVWATWEKQGLAELGIGPDGEPAWMPTEVGTLVLGWER